MTEFHWILFRYLWGLKVQWQKEAEWLTSSKLITNPWRFLDWLVKCQTLMREVLREQFSWDSFHMCLIGKDEKGVGFRLVIFQEASNQISDLGLSFTNSINPLKQIVCLKKTDSSSPIGRYKLIHLLVQPFLNTVLTWSSWKHHSGNHFSQIFQLKLLQFFLLCL